MNTKDEISTCQSFPGVYRFLNPSFINPFSSEALSNRLGSCFLWMGAWPCPQGARLLLVSFPCFQWLPIHLRIRGIPTPPSMAPASPRYGAVRWTHALSPSMPHPGIDGKPITPMSNLQKIHHRAVYHSKNPKQPVSGLLGPE